MGKVDTIDSAIDEILNKYQQKNCYHSWVTRVNLNKMIFNFDSYRICTKCGEIK